MTVLFDGSSLFLRPLLDRFFLSDGPGFGLMNDDVVEDVRRCTRRNNVMKNSKVTTHPFPLTLRLAQCSLLSLPHIFDESPLLLFLFLPLLKCLLFVYIN